VLRVSRQPASVIPAIAFPLILLAINSSGLDSATEIPGFPTDSYITFALAFCFVQAATFGVMIAGQNLGEDNESGFFNRLRLTSLRPAALLSGQLAGVLVLGVVQSVVFITVGLIAGAEIAAGAGGVALLIVMGTLITLAFGSIGILAGVRASSAEAVWGIFPLMFVFLFMSSMSIPRNLMTVEWFKTIATYNPTSYMVEGVRSLLITGWDAEALILGFACTIVIGGAAIALAAVSLRDRMARV
jgi:ABC-2 type transport system permease protein